MAALMNQHLKPFSLPQLLVKLGIYVAVFYLLIITASLVITGYIFFNLDAYRERIQKTVYTHTGYKLIVGSIKPKLSNSYLPEVLIENISLINPVNQKQSAHLNSLDFVFSYASIWDLEPIFNQILVDGTDLSIVYDSANNIFVNGINVSNPDRQTLENTKNSPIDLESWLLKQRRITFKHITLAYLDKKNGLPSMTLHNIKFGLESYLWHKHRLYLDVYGKSVKNQLEAELTWQGGKFADWLIWKNARLKVNTINGKDTLVNTLQQYLPGLSTVPNFNAITAVDAKMLNGQLQNLYANFDVNNFKLALADADLVNFPKLGGNLNIQLINPHEYSIQAKNLVLVTGGGILFDNASANGHYTRDKNGQISLSNTNLMAINNFLSLFRVSSGISLDGTIKIVKFEWQGSFIKPQAYQLYAAFKDISFRSTRASLPSLSHISGDIALRKESGNLNLVLKDSTLNYASLFLIPYKFKNLLSQIDWQISAQNILTVNLHKTHLETPDFSAWVAGRYTYNPKNLISPSFLDMKAHVARVLTSKVGDYLPKSIPLSVHHWLNMGLIGGYGVNANMILKGPLASFPFKNEKGLFYITADLDHAKLKYAQGWPALESIQGQFILRNTNITIKSQTAVLEKNQLDPTLVVIPDYSDPHGVYLTASGKAHGLTENFITYLRNTPVNEIIGHLPEKLKASGKGNIDIYLKVPFKEPKLSEVNGVLHFTHNTLKFDLPIPLLTDVNGDLGFTHKGVDIHNLQATAFNSRLALSALTNPNGQINFKIKSADLDYKQLAVYYVPAISNLFGGRAATTINFELAKSGMINLLASSDLIGVECVAAVPLKKAALTSAPLRFRLTPGANATFIANFDYAHRLKGQISLGKNGGGTHGKLALNNSEYLLDADPSSVFTINATPESVNIEDWLATAKLITTPLQDTNALSLERDKVPGAVISNTAAGKSEHFIFPLQIWLKTNKLMLNKINLDGGVTNIMLDTKHAYFNIYTPVISGFGDFNYSKYRLKLNLDKFMLYKTKPKLAHKGENSPEINFMNGAMTKITEKIPQIELTINNLFYQNHNLGKATTYIHQEDNDLYVESGILASSDALVNFYGVNSCFGCGREASYVDFKAQAKINDLGNLLHALDLGRVVGNGHGNLNAVLQWNGGFQDFDILQTVGSVKANFAAGKFLKVNPGLVGGLMSIINLQGIFELGSGDVTDLFKLGFYFNDLDLDADILTSQVDLNHIYMSGPMAKVNSSGKVNFATNLVDAYLSVTPKLGFAVAITAGVVTLNPFVGLGVYLGELIFGDPQNKLFTFSYHVSGNLLKPNVQRTSVSQQFVKNVNSTVGN